MSTTEKIFEALQATTQEKKKALTDSYKEKSVWLSNEFEVIKKLIQQNPRDNCLAKPEAVAVAEPAVASSSARRESSLDGKKRKSPETVNAVKLSPQQKRSSIDVDELLVQAGIRGDLNKLTKEQLLAELKKLGNTNFTQKQLKKELIDGLRDAVVANYHAKNVEQSAASTTVDASELPRAELEASADAPEQQQSASSEMVLSTPSKPAAPASAVSRVSQMADIRLIVTAQSQTAPAAPVAPAIESEYQARQNRHRESVARMSMASSAEGAPALHSSEPVAPVVLVLEQPVAVAPAPAAAPAVVETKEAEAAPAPATAAGFIYPADDVWMEVSSPVREPQAEESGDKEVSTELPPALVLPAEEAQVESAEPSPVAAVTEETRPRSESDASFVSCISTASIPKPAAAPAAASARESAASVSSTASATRPAAVATGAPRTMSTLKSNATDASKPVVPSVKPAMSTFQKAKMTTATTQPTQAPASTSASAASAALAQKKKDPVPEFKSSSGKVATANPATSAPSSAASAPAPAPTTVAATGAAASSGAAVPPKKAGIFGFLSNAKKPTAPGAATGATAGSAPSAPTTVSAAPPAMVDAIIQSAKADALIAPAPVPAPAPSTAVKPAATEAPAVHTPPDVREAIAAANSASKALAGVPLKDAFASKSLLSSIVSNYNNALKSGNNAVHGTPAAKSSAPAAAPVAPVQPAPVAVSVAPVQPTPVLRDITAAATAPASAVKATQPATSAPVPPTPVAAQAAATPAAPKEKEYVIEDRDSSDESGTDGENEEDAEAARKKAESIPDWARGPKLKEALERQYGMHGQTPMDPDLIFPEVTTCSLEEIFGVRQSKNNKKYNARSSSAHWDADQMTLVEKRTYRKHMGYDRPPIAPVK